MHIIIIENAEQIRKRTENIHIRISLLLKYVQKIKTARFHFPKHTILTVTASPTLPPSEPIRQLHGSVRRFLGVHGAGLPDQPFHRLPPQSGNLQRCLLRRAGPFITRAGPSSPATRTSTAVHQRNATVQLQGRVRWLMREVFVRPGGRLLHRNAPEAIVEGPVLAEQFALFQRLRQSVVEGFRQAQTGEAAGHRHAAHDDQREDEVLLALEWKANGSESFSQERYNNNLSSQNLLNDLFNISNLSRYFFWKKSSGIFVRLCHEFH